MPAICGSQQLQACGPATFGQHHQAQASIAALLQTDLANPKIHSYARMTPYNIPILETIVP